MDQQQLEELCKRLKENDSSLLTLNLEYENLGAEGAALLAEALHQNKIVNFVCIQYSRIGFEGTKKLLEALKGRGIKTQLQVRDDYSDDEYSALLEMGPGAKKRDKTKERSPVSDAEKIQGLAQENQKN